MIRRPPRSTLFPLHDALPIFEELAERDLLPFEAAVEAGVPGVTLAHALYPFSDFTEPASLSRSEEHTSELQSRQYLVCRLLLEKKKISNIIHRCSIKRSYTM